MRILIVDDDPVIVEAIRDLVCWEKLGIDSVDTAFNAASAKQILLARPADIVISDIEMPGESGLELLSWYRRQGLEGRFLLLTSHEKFSYAQEALKLRAEEYLLKPFRVDMVEMVLRQLTGEILQERERELTKAAKDREIARRQILSLLGDLLSGRLSLEAFQEAAKEAGGQPFPDKAYRLVVSRATDMEKDLDSFGPSLLQFTLENLHAQELFETSEEALLVSFSQKQDHVIVALLEESQAPSLQEGCQKIHGRCQELLSLTLTSLISSPTDLAHLYGSFQGCLRILERDVIHYGEVFLEEDYAQVEEGKWQSLDLRVMEGFLEQRSKKAFLDYVKKEMDVAASQRILDHDHLLRAIREVRQVVYSYLTSRGILITLIIENKDASHLSRLAEQSVLDLLRWVNYLLSQTFSYEEEVARSQGLIAQIDAYIREHYREDIGRKEIGEAFYLVPEYVSRLYKKKTGIGLKDAINECRLQEARRLLSNTEERVSDIAMMVGFESFSYFSTLFKKNTGQSPNEYRKTMGKGE